MKYISGVFKLSAILIIIVSNSHAGMSYECWSYQSGNLGKMVHVTADNRDDAAQLAAVKFRDLSVPFDSVNCK